MSNVEFIITIIVMFVSVMGMFAVYNWGEKKYEIRKNK